MKGLLLSLLALALNIVATALVAHVLRPKRYLYLFAISSFVCGVVYVLLFLVTPPDLYFLPHSWMITESWLDLAYGLIIFFLNCHSFVDCFFATCGGFSVALLVAILERGLKPTSTDDLLAKFQSPPQPGQQGVAQGLVPVNGAPPPPREPDRIYGWRVPRLVKQGYIRRDETTQCYSLTPKGRMIAVITLTLKRLMNLGEGG